MDINTFYLNITLDDYEDIRIHDSMIPYVFILKYNMWGKTNNGYLYAEAQKGM